MDNKQRSIDEQICAGRQRDVCFIGKKNLQKVHLPLVAFSAGGLPGGAFFLD
jgi:hypothetical protein